MLVAPEPVEPAAAGPAAGDPVADRARSCAGAWRRPTRTPAMASSSSGSPAATASRATPTWRPTSSASCSRASSARLSAAALETLAIVAYKQPISRAQVASIRGVDPDGVVRTLQARGYVTEVARDPGPGQAVLWGTTPLFLEKLGLDSLADLPPLAGFRPRGRRRRGARAGPARHASGRCLTTRASASRRSWPRPGYGSRRVCEELIADGASRSTARWPCSVAGSTPTPIASRSTATPSATPPASCTTC